MTLMKFTYWSNLETYSWHVFFTIIGSNIRKIFWDLNPFHILYIFLHLQKSCEFKCKQMVKTRYNILPLIQCVLLIASVNCTYGAMQINTQWNHMGNTVFSWAKFIGLTKTNSHWVFPLLKTCTWIIFSEFCSAKGLILTHRFAFKFWWWLCL